MGESFQLGSSLTSMPLEKIWCLQQQVLTVYFQWAANCSGVCLQCCGSPRKLPDLHIIRWCPTPGTGIFTYKSIAPGSSFNHSGTTIQTLPKRKCQFSIRLPSTGYLVALPYSLSFGSFFLSPPHLSFFFFNLSIPPFTFISHVIYHSPPHNLKCLFPLSWDPF